MSELLSESLRKLQAAWEEQDYYLHPAAQLTPLIASAVAQEQELAALREHHQYQFEPLDKWEQQHEADLREVAEMAVRRAMNRINHPSQVGKIADIVLREFREKKAEAGE